MEKEQTVEAKQRVEPILFRSMQRKTLEEAIKIPELKKLSSNDVQTLETNLSTVKNYEECLNLCAETLAPNNWVRKIIPKVNAVEMEDELIKSYVSSAISKSLPLSVIKLFDPNGINTFGAKNAKELLKILLKPEIKSEIASSLVNDLEYKIGLIQQKRKL